MYCIVNIPTLDIRRKINVLKTFMIRPSKAPFERLTYTQITSCIQVTATRASRLCYLQLLRTKSQIIVDLFIFPKEVVKKNPSLLAQLT